MSLILSGTNGVSDVDGTAATPALRGTDTNTGIFFPAADTIAFSEGGVEAARFDSVGNLGIGTSSPAYKLTVSGGDIALDNTRAINFKNSSGGYGNVLSVDSSNRVNFGDLVTSASAMVLSSGNLGLGVTPSAWSTAWKGFQFGQRGAVYAHTSVSATNISDNVYDDGSSRYIVTGTAQRYQMSAGAHQWFTAPSGTAGNVISFTQAMTLDASGQLMVGKTSNSYGDASTRTFEISGSSSSIVALQYGGANGYYLQVNSTAGYLWNSANTPIVFGTNNTERARIDSGGRFLLGSTSSVAPAGTIVPLGYRGRQGTGGTEVNNFNIAWNGSAANLWIDTTNQGAITTSSDYRIKKNVETQTAPAIDRVMRLRPVTYELADYGDLFKADGVQREGFIAHEVQEVIPSGAEGQKDEEGRIQNLKVDAILSVAVKAIQELNAKLEAQAAEIAALKGTA